MYWMFVGAEQLVIVLSALVNLVISFMFAFERVSY